jgi:hypothetical protein
VSMRRCLSCFTQGTWGAMTDFGSVVQIGRLPEAAGQLGGVAVPAAVVDSASRREAVDISGTEEALAM